MIKKENSKNQIVHICVDNDNSVELGRSYSNAVNTSHPD